MIGGATVIFWEPLPFPVPKTWENRSRETNLSHKPLNYSSNTQQLDPSSANVLGIE